MTKKNYNNERRKQAYNDLREAGFTTKEANRLKGSPEAVRIALESGVAPPRNSRIHHARNVPYYDMGEVEKHYHEPGSKNFIISYLYKGDKKPHYITVTSPDDLYAYEVLDFAMAIFDGDEDKYNMGQIVKSSISIDYCVVNNDI